MVKRINSGQIRWKLISAIVVVLLATTGFLYGITNFTLGKASTAFVKAQGSGMTHFYLGIAQGEKTPNQKVNQIGALLANVKPIPGVFGYMVFTTPQVAQSAHGELTEKGSQIAPATAQIMLHEPMTKQGQWVQYVTTNKQDKGVPGQYLDAEAAHPGVEFVDYNGHLATLGPIMYQGKLVGITEVDQTPNEGAIPTVAKVLHNNLIYLFALMILLVVAMYFLIGRWVVRPIRYQAEHDLMTGLYNQMTFWQFFGDVSEQMKSRNLEVAMLTFDMDNFKSINDNYGHQQGDDVLRLLAGILQKHARKTDVLGRMGGEEFGLVLPGCSLEDALAIGEQIRSEVSTHSIADGERWLSISIGVANNELLDTYDPKEIAHGADIGLYVAKRTGKNKVVPYDPSINMEDLEPASERETGSTTNPPPAH